MKAPSRIDRIIVRVTSHGVIFMDPLIGLIPLIRAVNLFLDITEVLAN
jgi:hypothetical protein